MTAAVVATPAGDVRGVVQGDVRAFLGIPYALPPTGPLRFAPPRPHPGWQGELDATRYGPAAPQPVENRLSGLVPGAAPEGPQDEDCLTLNIWTPTAALPDDPRPVMVWIHGGGFVLGGSSLAATDGARLASRHDVVVVSLNYRLGLLGFLAVRGDGASPNCGILDQQEALRWVARCIGSFGGDPSRVTVFGESAGGGSILSLLASPGSAGLFRRAIVQSGASNQFPAFEDAERTAEAVFAHLGLRPGHVEGLREVPLERLLEAQDAVSAGAGMMPFHPTDDGEVLVARWEEARRRGVNADVALVIGTTEDEMRLFAATDPKAATMDRDRLVARTRALGLDPPTVLAAYEERMFDATWSDRWWALFTDVAMWIPALDVAEAHAEHDGAVWMYRFGWPAADPNLGACHGIDIPFPFENLDRGGWWDFVADPDEAQHLAHRLAGHWASFARDGDPGWPRFDTVTRTTKIFGRVDALVDDPHRACRRALRKRS